MSTESNRAIRLTAVLTHPVQYYSAWFRHVATHAPEIDLTVLYATEPTAEQQGTGFEHAFQWDVPLRAGYRSSVIRAARQRDRVDSGSFLGLNVRGIGAAIRATSPDVLLVPGWHSIVLVRALLAARRFGVPVLFRGDTNLGTSRSGFKRFLWETRTKHLLSLYDAYLSPGTRVQDYLQAFGGEAWQIVETPHCVDNELFATAARPFQSPEGRADARAMWGLPAAALVLLFVGKLEEKKRPLDLIRAAAELTPRPSVLVVGAGPLESACRAEASRLGVQTVFAGFLNQSELGAVYAAADMLVLPSDARETWGLVVNEALATGLPAVVSGCVGCAPDLIDDQTGATFPCGDVAGLAAAVDRVRKRGGAPAHDDACRARIRRFDVAAATAGLVDACRRVARVPRSAPRVVACCGNMVTVTGLERMAFTLLGSLQKRGGRVHCVVNSWENHRIVAEAQAIGATWSEGGHKGSIKRRHLTARRIVAMLRDIRVSSAALQRAVQRLRATHVLLPDHLAPVRNVFALAWLRPRGVRVIMALANAPDQSRFYRFYWRWFINSLVDHFVCNSNFTRRELEALGIPPRKVSTIYNALPLDHSFARTPVARQRGRIVYVGQVIPGKGLDLLIEAVALLKLKGVSATLTVVGDVDGWTAPEYVPFRQALRARAASPDLEGRVNFLGWRDDVVSVMAKADVHCAPSRPEIREGFGLVNLEAKQAGVPSVVFPSGAYPEVIRHKVDGWVCTDISAEGLAEGLEYFLTSTARRDAAAEAARRSLARFDVRVFEDSWWNVFSPSGIERRTSSGIAGPIPARGEATR